MAEAIPKRVTALQRALAAAGPVPELGPAELGDRLILRLEMAAAGNAVLGGPLPAVGEVATREAAKLLGLGPKSWFVVAPEDARADLLERLGPLPDAALVDVSQAYALLRLTGSRAAEALSATCPVDLHPTAFPAGRCFQSNLAGHRVLVEAEAGGTLLYLERSVAVSFWDLLLDAARA